jgi:hypothetical protein
MASGDGTLPDAFMAPSTRSAGVVMTPIAEPELVRRTP